MDLKRTVIIRAASGPGTNVDLVGNILGDLMKQGLTPVATFDPSDSIPEFVHYTVSSETEAEAIKAERLLRQHLDRLGYTIEP